MVVPLPSLLLATEANRTTKRRAAATAARWLEEEEEEEEEQWRLPVRGVEGLMGFMISICARPPWAGESWQQSENVSLIRQHAHTHTHTHR